MVRLLFVPGEPRRYPSVQVCMNESLRSSFSWQMLAVGACCVVAILVVTDVAFPILTQALEILGLAHGRFVSAAFSVAPFAMIAAMLARKSDSLDLDSGKLAQLLVIGVLSAGYIVAKFATGYTTPLELFARYPLILAGGFTCYPSYAADLFSFTAGPDRPLCLVVAIVCQFVYSWIVVEVVNATPNSSLRTLLTFYMLSLLLNALNFVFIVAAHV